MEPKSPFREGEKCPFSYPGSLDARGLLARSPLASEKTSGIQGTVFLIVEKIR